MPVSIRRLLQLESEKLDRKRRRDALARAKEVAAFLKDRYAVKKVVLYGSLARGNFTQHSDIDLYVEGFERAEDYWRMQVEAEEIARPYPLSIVLADDATPSLRREVGKEGVEL